MRKKTELKLIHPTITRGGQEYEKARHQITSDTYSNSEKGCVLCEDREVNLKEENGVAYRLPRSPYSPGHFMITTTDHVSALNKMSETQFKNFFDAAGKVIHGMNLQGMKTLFFANVGAIGGQTIKHVHGHFVPLNFRSLESSALKSHGFEVSSLGKGSFFDPLSMQLMHSMQNRLGVSPSKVLRAAKIPLKRGEAIVLKFDSFNHLKNSYSEVRKLFSIAQETLSRLEENPESAISLEKIYGKNAEAKRKSDVKLLKTGLLNHYFHGADNFGAHLMLVEKPNSVELHFIPRATAAVWLKDESKGAFMKPEKIPLKRIKAFHALVKKRTGLENPNLFDFLAERRFGGLQHFTNTHMAKRLPETDSENELDKKFVSAFKSVIGL